MDRLILVKAQLGELFLEREKLNARLHQINTDLQAKLQELAQVEQDLRKDASKQRIIIEEPEISETCR